MVKKPYKPKPRTDRNAVGRTVARLRNASDLTQEDLAGRAAAVGWPINRYIVKQIERGAREVTDIELRRLAEALRVPIVQLFD